MTNAELVVLGLLAEQERYAYEIAEQIRIRAVRIWARVGFSSIYHALGSLERKGLVTASTQDSPVGPDRKVFSITDDGRRQLAIGALARLEQRLSLPSSFYVGLSLIPHLERGAVLDALRRHQEELAVSRTEMTKAGPNGSPVVEAMSDLDETLSRAEAQWLTDFVAELARAPDES